MSVAGYREDPLYPRVARAVADRLDHGKGNLSRLSRLLRILRFHAHDLDLEPSWTAYLRRGKRPKQQLRFTKTGDAKIEEVYATHFVWPGKAAFHPPAPKETRG